MRLSVSIDDRHQEMIKDAKKKAIDEDISLSEAIAILLEKWVNGETTIDRGQK